MILKKKKRHIDHKRGNKYEKNSQHYEQGERHPNNAFLRLQFHCGDKLLLLTVEFEGGFPPERECSPQRVKPIPKRLVTTLTLSQDSPSGTPPTLSMVGAINFIWRRRGGLTFTNKIIVWSIPEGMTSYLIDKMVGAYTCVQYEYNPNPDPITPKLMRATLTLTLSQSEQSEPWP